MFFHVSFLCYLLDATFLYLFWTFPLCVFASALQWKSLSKTLLALVQWLGIWTFSWISLEKRGYIEWKGGGYIEKNSHSIVLFFDRVTCILTAASLIVPCAFFLTAGLWPVILHLQVVLILEYIVLMKMFSFYKPIYKVFQYGLSIFL